MILSGSNVTSDVHCSLFYKSQRTHSQSSPDYQSIVSRRHNCCVTNSLFTVSKAICVSRVRHLARNGITDHTRYWLTIWSHQQFVILDGQLAESYLRVQKLRTFLLRSGISGAAKWALLKTHHQLNGIYIRSEVVNVVIVGASFHNCKMCRCN